MGQTLILGIGNILLSDDGVGVHTVRFLQQTAQFPEEVQVLDGGTKGLDLLQYLEGVSRLILIDAIETGDPPGTLTRIAGEQVPSYLQLKMSPHEIGLPDMLFAARLRDIYPAEVVVWGMQPATTEVGMELSPPVQAQVELLADKVLDELRGWGIQVERVAAAADLSASSLLPLVGE